jgi:hypothetical protein
MENSLEFGVEINLSKPDDFLKIKETLTRIGIKSKKTNTLYQSCSILHKRGKYYILHFKELFACDKKECDFTEDDERRRNTIVKMLASWGMCVILDKEKTLIVDPETPIDIIQYKDKKNWVLVSKYTVGKKK